MPWHKLAAEVLAGPRSTVCGGVMVKKTMAAASRRAVADRLSASCAKGAPLRLKRLGCAAHPRAAPWQRPTPKTRGF